MAKLVVFTVALTGSGPKSRGRTREQELEERCRRLETEVAYLKKLRALVERDGL